MRLHQTLFSEHAAMITVISMQLIVVFGEGAYDVWDFVVSSICLLFGLEALKIGYLDYLGRLLIAINIGISGTFSVIYSISFGLYFLFQWWFNEETIGSWFTDLPFVAYEILLEPSGGYSAVFEVGELIALIAIVPAWLLCKKRL